MAISLAHNILELVIAMFIIRFIQMNLVKKDSSLGGAVAYLFH